MYTIIKSIITTMSLIIFPLHTEFVTITSIDQFNDLLDQKIPIILKFSADYCPPCKITEQPFKDLANEKEFEDTAFIELDIQSSIGNSLSSQYKVLGVPTFIFIQNDKEVKKIVGVEHPAKFKEYFRTTIKEAFSQGPQDEKEQNQNNDIPAIKLEEDHTISKTTADHAQDSKPTEAGTLEQIWLTIKAFFIFIFDKVREAIRYIIKLIKDIFSK